MTLLRHFLASMPLYLLAVCNPPKCVLKRIESMFSHFLWGSNDGLDKRISVRWSEVAHLTNEGGLEMRRLQENTDVLLVKLWWKFRSKEALWISFFRAKYCRVHPSQVVAMSAASFAWLHLLSERTPSRWCSAGERHPSSGNNGSRGQVTVAAPIGVLSYPSSEGVLYPGRLGLPTDFPGGGGGGLQLHSLFKLCFPSV